MAELIGRRFPLNAAERQTIEAATAQLSDADVLNFVETRVFRRHSARDLGVVDALISKSFLLELSNLMSNEAGLVDRMERRSVLKSLAQPICIVEVRRVGKDHVAKVDIQEPMGGQSQAERRLMIAGAFRDFEQQLLDPTSPNVSDQDFAKQMIQRLNLASEPARTLPEDVTFAPDLKHLLKPIISLLSNNIETLRDTKKRQFLLETDRFLRSELLAWLSSTVRASKNESDATGLDTLSADDRFEDVLDVLPMVYAGSVANRPDLAFVVSVAPTDGWFVDESVAPQIGLMPEIVLGLYQVGSGLELSDPAKAANLQGKLRANLSSITAKRMAQSRGFALGSAAGEGSRISRTWFGEGVASLLGRATTDAHLKNESTLDFWTRFVEELLCARIDGVMQTETFPFDRAFIIADSGADPTSVTAASPRLRVRVLEAALESVDPSDRFQYSTSIERVGRSLEREFDVTRKRIEISSEFDIRRGRSGAIEMSRIDRVGRYSSNSRMREVSSVLEKNGISVTRPVGGAWPMIADMALESMISVMEAGADLTGTAEADVVARTKQQNESALRKAYSKEGFLYDFVQRSDFRKDFPLLSGISALYLQDLAEDQELSGFDPWSFGVSTATKRTEAKVVVVSYEPRLSSDNLRSDGGAKGAEGRQPYYLDPKDNRVTMILVADEDQEKSVPDLDSEREDLKLLVEMIFRQRLRDKRREVDFLEKRINVVEGLLNGLLHKFKASIEDDERRSELEAQWSSMRDTVRFDTSSLQAIGPFKNAHEYLTAIWRHDTPADDDESVSAADLESIIKQRVKQYADQFRSNGGTSSKRNPKVNLLFVPCPEFRLAVPRLAVRECLDVVMKNAVEAALSDGAPKPAEIQISIQHSYLSESKSWTLDFVVENTTGPIPEQIWADLTSDEPKETGEYKPKPNSTGVGVFASRQMLRNGLGARADITYQRIHEQWVQARIHLPAQLMLAERAVSPEDDDEEPDDHQAAEVQPAAALLLLEDEERHRTATLGALAKHAEHVAVDTAVCFGDMERALARGLPELFISDLNVPEKDDGVQGSTKFGLKSLRLFGEAAADAKLYPPVWIATGESVEDAMDKMVSGYEATGSVLGQGYQLLAQDKAEDLFAPGQAIVLSYKNLAMNEKAEDLAKQIGGRLSASEGETPAQPAGKAATKRAEIEAVAVFDLKEFQSAYSSVNESEHRAAELLLADGRKEKPEAAIAQWLGMPPLPIPEDEDDPAQPVWNPTWHNRARLIISEVDGTVWSPSMRYWLLQKNVVFAGKSLERSVAVFRKIKQESRGPIASARHDLFNILPDAMNDFTLLTQKLQTALDLPDSIKTRLSVPNLSSKEISATLIDSASAAQASFDATDVDEAARALFIKLESAAKSEPQVEERIARVIECLKATLTTVGATQ